MIKRSIYIVLLLGAIALVTLAAINKPNTRSLLPEFHLFERQSVVVDSPTEVEQNEQTAVPTLADTTVISEPTTEAALQ